MTRAATTSSPITRAEETPAPQEPDVPAAHGKPATASRSKVVRSESDTTERRGKAYASTDGKLTRLSVDVPRTQHVFLRVEAAQAGVTGMAVVRALISEMQDDADLARRIRDRLAEDA